GRADHVEVDHAEDPPAFARAQALDVAPGADELELLGAPEREPQPVLRPHGDPAGWAAALGDGRGAGAVVVDARSVRDRVEVPAEKDDAALPAWKAGINFPAPRRGRA